MAALSRGLTTLGTDNKSLFWANLSCCIKNIQLSNRSCEFDALYIPGHQLSGTDAGVLAVRTNERGCRAVLSSALCWLCLITHTDKHIELHQDTYMLFRTNCRASQTV
jgi:hypothetical protein